MRILKLQMQLSIDGFVARQNGELDWMLWNWDDELKDFVNKLHEPVDTILLGRVLAEGFIPAWQSRLTDPESAAFAKKMVDTLKIIFSNTLRNEDIVSNNWDNAELSKEDFVQYITWLKKQPGNDIIAYGGSRFVASLIEKGLIDDYYLFVNPSAIGSGMTIFNRINQKQNFNLVKAKQFPCGIVLLNYTPVKG